MESHKCNILIFIQELNAFFKNGNDRPLSYLKSCNKDYHNEFYTFDIDIKTISNDR